MESSMFFGEFVCVFCRELVLLYGNVFVCVCVFSCVCVCVCSCVQIPSYQSQSLTCSGDRKKKPQQKRWCEVGPVGDLRVCL